MNQSQLISRVNSSMCQQVNNTGYATAVQTLMDLDILSKENYERWRNGQIPYLEKVCKINLKKLAGVLEEMKSYAGKNNLKPRFTFYKQWGRKNKSTVQLRFSKNGNEYIEKLYATHYVKTINKTN
ncbi:hypothetical protein [Butyrivibrio sp. INlla14]|uniref:hypothetical protein n=1 Tax=Butyrivibrio sp. INlla14 TaxID=1520808 RepID=UPI00087740C5|nr:hypothetical protein [Butyrivibrio sp. INlla14]SCY10389.1 hypothetical protein SAMN02910371_01073 [Butyrivibrio sp. INlla14]